jgi:bifunctional NMN adenylyltransferase/nudix hydrolase
MQTPTPSVGVVVGRFQVATLHAGHHYLLDYVQSRHETFLIVIGTTQGFPNKKNPLSYAMREAMLRKAYPHAVILPHGDHPSNDEWSKELDLLIAHHFPGEEALLYGSRDSFIPHYRGKNKTIEVPQIAAKSGTDYRREASAKVLQSPAFRRGVIHTQEKRFPIPYPAVDVAIINPPQTRSATGGEDERWQQLSLHRRICRHNRHLARTHCKTRSIRRNVWCRDWRHSLRWVADRRRLEVPRHR